MAGGAGGMMRGGMMGRPMGGALPSRPGAGMMMTNNTSAMMSQQTNHGPAMGRGMGGGPLQPSQPAVIDGAPVPRKLSIQPQAAAQASRPRSPDGFPTLEEIPDLDNKPKAKGAVPLNQIKPPAFDDEMDDEAMEAEEQAFLARMRAQEQGNNKAKPADPKPAQKPAPPSMDDFDDFDDLDDDYGRKPAAAKASAPPQPFASAPQREPPPPPPAAFAPKPAPPAMDDFDDLSEEELE